MTNQEILEKAIQKAIAGGWKPWWGDDRLEVDETPYIKTYNDIYDEPGFMEFAHEQVIFNHDFAKALWGEVPEKRVYPYGWKQHLQRMVIADDPIKYLGEHI
jgi:hypothetical protein